MKLKKIKRRMLSITLTIAIALTGTGMSTLANSMSISANSEVVQKSQKKDKELTEIKELKSERTENSNTYLMSDGSKKLEIYSEAIRYKEDGEWVDYDTSLTDLGVEDKENLENIVGDISDKYSKVNKKGDTKQYFPEDLHDNAVVMNKGKYVLSFKPVIEENDINEENKEIQSTDNIDTQINESENDVQSENNIEITQEADTTEIWDVYTPEVNKDTVIYSSQSSSIKYEYISLNNGVKENIILAEQPQTNELLFDIDSKKIKFELEEDGSISLKNIKTDKKVGYIMAPNIIDGEGNINYECIRYELVEVDGEVVLKIVIDETYFNNENLKYPVTVDPTALWYGEKLPVAIVNNVTGRSDDVVSSNELLVENNYVYGEGTETRSSRVYIDTSNFIPGNDWLIGNPELSGKYIENSYLYLSEKSASVNPVLVEVRSVEEVWDVDTITWNNQPEISEDLIARTWNRGIDSRTHGINLTKWIQGIADGSIENNGIVLMAGEEGTQCSYYGTEERISQFMCLDIIYRDIEKYDATITMNAEYNSETGKVQTTLEDGNELAEDVTVKGYKIFARKNNAEKFISIYEGTNISETAELDMSDIESVVDYRACILYSDGVVKPSNIVSFERYKYTEEEAESETVESELESTESEEETTENSVTVYYEQVVMDTDGDGLEDGYEIWDFKTLWNTEVINETTGDIEFEIDTDNDDLPDGYEVFTLGTDPAVANRYDENGKEIDTDKDLMSDYIEYVNHTDPLIKDSDFDGNDDATEQKDRRKTNGETDQSTAASTNIIKGLYDREYSEIEDGVTYTYIQNIYNGNIREIDIDYGDISLNKVMRYFYDEYGNNTAIIEQYDEEYDPKGESLICITYTYNDENNVEYICDQTTNYTMSYNEDGEMDSLSVGNQELVAYSVTDLLENNTNTGQEDGETTEEGSGEDLLIGTIIEKTEKVSYYGVTRDSSDKITDDEGEIRTVTSVYQLAENDITSAKTVEEIYYDDSTEISYRIEYTSEGNIKSIFDYTNSQSEPIEYIYTYSDSGVSVKKNNEFYKSSTEVTDESEKTSTITTSYGFKDVQDQSVTYSSVAILDISEDNLEENQVTLYNGDISNCIYNSEEKEYTRNIFSTLYNSDVFTFTQTEKSKALTEYDINIYAEDKKYEYIYDLAGNITQISIDGIIKYQYAYDPHGRLTEEKDYVDGKCHVYLYNLDTGNIKTHWICPMSSTGDYSLSNGTAIESDYTDTDWSDQLSYYNGNEITYNDAGNPVKYHNNLKFSWERGRQLSGIKFANNDTDINDVTYKYNENGLRTYKDTPDTTTTYEWDETTLIRETVKYKATNKIYDIWYFYDSTGEVIGFEYSFINDDNRKSAIRVYYEKDLQGNVIGLLDSRGAEIAKYSYDAWGNITDSMCYEGNEVPFALNHVTYRSYYKDNETGFYYLQSRYYDPEICRFINADDIKYLGSSGTVWGYNLYSYCENNPVNYTDPEGYSLLNVILAAVFAIAGWYFGDWLAYKLIGKKNWKYWTLRTAIAVGGAALGWFAGTLIAKYIATYLRNHPDKLFKLISKLGSKTFYNAMVFLGINPFTLSLDGSKFIAIARALNSTSITLSYEWAKQLYYKATSLGFNITLDKPHGGYSWHIHLSGGNGKLSKLHIQVVKSVWDYLSKLIK